ncbi:MAG TPA: TraR/DksA family transcriptional regulator [Candidatus Polarisedimenticolaceae bacterium]|nr:TraR/DksA family transcriptional regulator [Candidatus Polarisedimenticolaceae bacterium]
MKSKPAKAKTVAKREPPKPVAKKPAAKAAPKLAPAKPAAAKAAPAKTSKVAAIAKTAKTVAVKAAPKPPPKPKAPPKPPPISLKKKDLQHFRELLVKKRQELMRAYSISKGDSQSDLDNGTEDYVDYAVNSYAREFLLSLTELERKQLLLVEEALGRIDRGEYGRCQQCGEEINRKRLEVQPWARHCVRCQELEEKGLLPQFPAQASEEEYPDEPEETAPRDEDLETDVEPEEAPLDEEPLVVDGDDPEE